MESISSSRLPLIETETVIPDIEHPTRLGSAYTDPQTAFSLRNTTRRTRELQRSIRRLFRRNGNNGMVRNKFLNLTNGKSSGSSITGLRLRSVISLNTTRRKPAVDKIIQQSYEEEPLWWEDGMDEAVDQLPLLGASTRSGVL